ncbi:MAG: hypothetical protein RML94_16700 [Bacteroidia bacterium]|nr:hypothetical protein [Bacteroidia bacterium]
MRHTNSKNHNHYTDIFLNLFFFFGRALVGVSLALMPTRSACYGLRSRFGAALRSALG